MGIDLSILIVVIVAQVIVVFRARAAEAGRRARGLRTPDDGRSPSMENAQPQSQSILDTLRTVEFRLGLKGYNVDEVDEYLEKAAVEAEALHEQLRQVNERLRQATERIAQLEAERSERPPECRRRRPSRRGVPTRPLQRTLLLAQKFVDQTKRESEAEAAELVAQAEEQARATVAQAEEQARQLTTEAEQRLREEVTRLEAMRGQLANDVENMARHLEAERNRLRAALAEVLKWVDENVQPASSLMALRPREERRPTSGRPVRHGPAPGTTRVARPARRPRQAAARAQRGRRGGPRAEAPGPEVRDRREAQRPASAAEHAPATAARYGRDVRCPWLAGPGRYGHRPWPPPGRPAAPVGLRPTRRIDMTPAKTASVTEAAAAKAQANSASKAKQARGQGRAAKATAAAKQEAAKAASAAKASPLKSGAKKATPSVRPPSLRPSRLAKAPSKAAAKAPAKAAKAQAKAPRQGGQGTGQGAPRRRPRRPRQPAKAAGPAKAAKAPASARLQGQAGGEAQGASGRRRALRGRPSSSTSSGTCSQLERAIYLEQATDLKAEADSLAQEREPGDVQFDEESGEGGTVTVDRERDLALSAQALAGGRGDRRRAGPHRQQTYGACERCHQPIPKPRLRALPYARLCVACKSGGLSRR